MCNVGLRIGVSTLGSVRLLSDEPTGLAWPCCNRRLSLCLLYVRGFDGSCGPKTFAIHYHPHQ
jgi:hypothetical protein